MEEEVVFDYASEASGKKTPLKKCTLDARPSKSACSTAKALRCVMVAGALLLVALLFMWKNFNGTRIVTDNPISTVDPFGGDFDIDELIRELNRNGEKIYLSSLTSEGADGCSVDTPVLPKGQPTVITFKTKENTEREAVVYVPDSYPTAVNGTAPRPVALMLLFHGLNNNCKHFLDSTGFMPYADHDGFVIASVCGSVGLLGVGWNAGMCCGFTDDNPDDVSLAKQVVEELSQILCIDKARVISAGFSNGAMLSEVLACEAPATFRAIASVGGVVEARPGNEAGLAACTAAAAKASSTARASVLLIHGTADALVPWGGNAILGFPPLLANLEGWRQRNGCTEETNTTISTETYTNTIYTHCNLSSAVPIRMAGAEAEQPVKRFHSDSYLDLRLMERKETAGQSAKVSVALTGRERFVSHVHPEYLRVGRWNRGATTQRTYKLDSRKARGHQRGLEAVERMKSQKSSHGTMSQGGQEDTYPLLRGQSLQEAHERCANGTHCQPYQSVSATGSKESRKVPMLRDVILRVPIGASQVELVRVDGGSHRWPRDKEFSTTDYIYEFGKRIFGSYS
ncbi:hypothetical protein GH5_00509 [Leishmania sp. Ghana 2012 LV757]|uniref:hypothetical protein n=1 Tax=Leishmania sp. Ghana 2012 LV757 TaxID=2803181 RepID=UPI001B49E81E|nr:hypothetical protein GH5_00509 [Leishmania sp. Ghana 2012 LV757]